MFLAVPIECQHVALTCTVYQKCEGLRATVFPCDGVAAIGKEYTSLPCTLLDLHISRSTCLFGKPWGALGVRFVPWCWVDSTSCRSCKWVM